MKGSTMRRISVLSPHSLAQILLARAVLATACMAVGAAGSVAAAVPLQEAQPAQATAPQLSEWMQASQAPAPEAERVLRGRLARMFAQQSRLIVQREQIFLGGLEGARTLMTLAARLDPDNPYIWRLALDLASALEEGDDASARLGSEALEQLSRLDPDDQMVRLRRLIDAVSRRQTAEERIEALERLLEPSAIERIGHGVGARLAFELALLRQRTGDSAGFERELIRALDLDPMFPEATEIAAGYFRMRAPGKAEEASSLRAAVLANPSRTPAALGLAALCLENAAYGAAADILNVEAEAVETKYADDEFDALLADLVLAFWGAERPEMARAVYEKRQGQVDSVLRSQFEQNGVPMTVDQRRKARMPLLPALATNVAAVVHAREPSFAKAAVMNAASAADFSILKLERAEADKASIAAAALEGAFVQLWLDGEVSKAKELIDRAEISAQVSPEARARFDGWLAIRAGEAARAKELLAPLASADRAAALGLAVAQESLGERKEAARGFLEIARAMPASAMGLWARERLRAIVGNKDVQVVSGAAEVERAAALPPEFMELMQRGRESMLLRIKPRLFEVRAWDPILFDIEFTNRSDWPLAISPDGPLMDTATLSASVNAAGRKVAVPAFTIVPIDRVFCVMPGETLTVPFDISLTDVATAIRADPVNGSLISVHSIVNWRPNSSGIEPGPMGIEVESPVVHVAGEKVTREWVETALARLSSADSTTDAEAVALLAFAINRVSRAPESLEAGAREALAAAPAAITAAVPRLSPEARAWLVLAAPIGRRASDQGTAGEVVEAAAGGGIELPSTVKELEPFDAALRADTHPLVRAAWVAARVRRSEDPVLASCADSNDPELAVFARNYRAWLADAEAERRRQLNLNP